MDNQSMLTICSTVVNYDGAIRYAKKSNKIAEMVRKKVFTIQYVATEDNVAAIFTKALGPQRFEKLRQQLRVTSVLVMIKHQDE